MSARNKSPHRVWAVILLLCFAVAIPVVSRYSCRQEGPDHGPTPALTKVILAQNPVPHSALPIIAKHNGYFRQEGLDVEVKEFATGKLCFDAMVGGSADFSTVAETPIMYAGFGQLQVVVVASIESSDLSVKVLARKDKGVNRPGDLQGKLIGTFKGGSAEYFLAQFLRKHGLTMKDVKVTYMQPPELVTAVIRGDLAAIAMWEPHIYNAQKAIGDQAVVFTGEDLYTETFHIAVTQDYANRNVLVVERFLRALAKAEEFLKANPERAKQILLAAIPIDAEILNHIWPDFRFDLILEKSTIDLLEKEAEFAKQTGAVPPDSSTPDYRKMFAPRFLERVKVNGVKFE